MLWFCKSCKSINLNRSELCYRCGFDVVAASWRRDPYGFIHLFPKTRDRWLWWTRRRLLAIEGDGFVVYLSEEQAKELVLLIIERLEVGRKSS